jgi:hypothetical protein
MGSFCENASPPVVETDRGAYVADWLRSADSPADPLPRRPPHPTSPQPASGFVSSAASPNAANNLDPKLASFRKTVPCPRRSTDRTAGIKGRPETTAESVGDWLRSVNPPHVPQLASFRQIAAPSVCRHRTFTLF